MTDDLKILVMLDTTKLNGVFTDTKFGDIPLSTTAALNVVEVTEKYAEDDNTGRLYVAAVDGIDVILTGVIEFTGKISQAIGGIGTSEKMQLTFIFSYDDHDGLIEVMKTIESVVKSGSHHLIHQDIVFMNGVDLSGTVEDIYHEFNDCQRDKDPVFIYGDEEDNLYNNDEDEDDEEDENNSPEMMLLRSIFNTDEDDDDDDNDGYSVERSRSLRKSSHPKRSIRNHRILIASSDDIKRDRKIIKAFLEEFIPGKSGWMRDYRNIVLKRWLRSFAISKGDARKYEREFKSRNRTNCISSVSTSVSRYLDRPTNHRKKREYDLFYDINR